jgi:hypothetical protein
MAVILIEIRNKSIILFLIRAKKYANLRQKSFIL